jgi:uncharacterized membrane protein
MGRIKKARNNNSEKVHAYMRSQTRRYGREVTKAIINTVAPMITMFFLITYTMINLVVLIEQTLNMVSFRPRFQIPRWVPLLGTVGCMFAMFIISPSFGLVALTLVLGVYIYLTRRAIDAPHGDMRSGLFVALAEWAAKSSSGLPTENERAWKPNMLLPFQDPREVRGTFGLVRDIAHPRGGRAHGRAAFRRRPARPIGRARHRNGVCHSSCWGGYVFTGLGRAYRGLFVV